MNGQGMELALLAMAAAYMLLVAVRRTQGRSLGWRIGAVLIWIGLFAGLALVADRMGLRPS